MALLGLFYAYALHALFWGIALLTLIRIYRVSNNKQATGDTSPAKDISELCTPVAQEKTPYGKILLFTLGVRLLIPVIGFILVSSEGYSITIAELFNYSFRRGDSNHYLHLATVGYGWTENGNHLLLVFFPLYGWLVGLINLLLGHYLVSAYIVSFVSFAAALCYLYRLVRLEFSASAAWWTLIFISIAPHSFFFGVPMTESLFLLTTVMTLYYIRTHKWHLAGIAGAFAIMTRMAGIILIVAAIIELIAHEKLVALLRTTKWKTFFCILARKGAWIAVMLVGGLVYLAINWYISGDPFRFMYYQQTHWHNEFAYFGSVLFAQFENIAAQPHLANAIFIPNILAFTLAIAALTYAAIKRLSSTYIVYVLGYIFMSFAVSWLLSGGRYIVAAAPVFIFLGHFAAKWRIAGILFALAFFAGLLFTMREYLLGGMIF
ncbi:MAG: glycosyltransferase family 39 protein [Oscillospiraceae bacterium]|nr:glycosyltransferase family 39 protein [Oscillospiraceae bacterium]